MYSVAVEFRSLLFETHTYSIASGADAENVGIPMRNRLFSVFEVLFIFAVFAVFGSWPIPDSNEPYYIGKAIHYWHADWIPNDTFLESKDAHLVFYWTFGRLSFFFSPPTMAWIGRWTAWLLLAWSWQRLSSALISIRWTSIFTATVLAYYVDSFHMAGEWIIGGVEGKSFAFPLVFLGLEAAVRGHWNRGWIFLGAASAFHVLIGGWAVLVVGFMWCLERFKFDPRTPNLDLRILFLGGLLALPGLIPALWLDSGVPREVVHQSHQIYVFERLFHHLVPSMLPWTYPARFALLGVLWFFVCRSGPIGGRRHRRLDAFIFGTLILSGVGLLADYGLQGNRPLAAEILRFYWFRLADFAVPMGVALGGTRRLVKVLSGNAVLKDLNILQVGRTAAGFFIAAFALYLLLDYLIFGVWFFSWIVKPEQGIPWLLTLLVGWSFLALIGTASRSVGLILLYGAILIYAPLGTLSTLGDQRTRFAYSRIDPPAPQTANDWIKVCYWIRYNTLETSKFWVPRESATFSWYALRSDIGVWKNVPQDATGIVRWSKTMRELFSDEKNGIVYGDRLVNIVYLKTPEELERLRSHYGFDHIVIDCGGYPEFPHLPALQLVYPTEEESNDCYRVYRVMPQER